MNFKQITKKIFYQASVQKDSEKLESFIECYENLDKKDIPECVHKWDQIYSFYGGSDMLEKMNKNKKPS